MLELLITLFPGVLVFLYYKFSHPEYSWKKILFYILFYTVTVNLCILVGLKLIGMKSFNLFEMSTRFKIKWLALEAVLSVWITWVIRNIQKTDLSTLKHLAQRLFPVTLFLTVTYAIFTPSSLFLGNIKEFSLRYTDILPIVLCMTLFLFVTIYFIALWLIREKTLPFYIALLFSFATGAYIQSNFLNSALPILDGSLVHWKEYRTENLISLLVWVSCILIFFIAACLKKKQFEKFAKYVSYFFSAMQLVSLIILVIMNPLNEGASYGFSKEGEFSIGSEENIIIFVLDTLQENVMEEYLSSDAYEKDGTLEGFTLFDNAVSGGAPTNLGMPLLLTGVECDPAQEDYLTEAWAETQLYDDLHQNGYDVRLYSVPQEFQGFPNEYFDNYTVIGNKWIGDYPEFGKSLYQLVNYLLMPQFIKERFWLSTDTLLYNIKSIGYELNDVYFHNDFSSTGETLQTTYKKAFRLYHLQGVHPAYNMTEDFERVWDYGVTEQTVLRGDMRIIYSYINALKRAGVYDTSTIIITGDHGRHDEGNPETNPAVLIKFPSEGDPNKLVHSSAPIHFRNVHATIASAFLDDYSAYGPSVFDITETSDVERLHTIDHTIMEERIHLKSYDESLNKARLIVLGDASNLEYQVWNPYEINRINYRLGDVIDFTSDNLYANQINYRLYKENGAVTASNELSLCFYLENAPKNDLKFHFAYSDIYNDKQKIRVYAGGNKVDDIICSPPGNTSKNVTIKIPKSNIKNNCLILRMVFPNAVTPKQLDKNNPDTRILSVVFDSMWLE